MFWHCLPSSEAGIILKKKRICVQLSENGITSIDFVRLEDYNKSWRIVGICEELIGEVANEIPIYN